MNLNRHCPHQWPASACLLVLISGLALGAIAQTRQIPTLTDTSGAIAAAPHKADGHATPRFKTRALWVDVSGYATAPATDKLIEKCSHAGINLILPNVLYHQTAYFKSSHFHGLVAANDQFDPLAGLLRKAHAADIEVQAWCCVYYEGGPPTTHPDWLDLSFDGQPFEKPFLSPANPEVNPYLLSVLKDLLAYDLAGIHLDYIRYPCTAFDYSATARTRFQSVAGFDPQDFLDHPERIIPSERDKFHVRVLHAKSHVEKIWKTTLIERTLDEAGIGFAFISETPENIAALRAPGLLIVSGYDEPTEPMLQAIQEYAARGGNVFWTDTPVAAIRKFPRLAKLTGLADGQWLPLRQVTLQPVGESALARQATNVFFAAGSFPTRLDGATVVASFKSGEPAITLNRVGQGRVLVTGFETMDGKAGRAIPLVRAMVDWCKSETGIVAPDLLAEKRRSWIQWRGDQVTQLVRDLSRAVKARQSQLMITSSGGPGAWEYYGCYRDARRWLSEGINDAVFPMNYTPDPAEFADLLHAQAAAAPPGKFDRIFPGVQLYDHKVVNGKSTTVPIAAGIVKQELQTVDQQGYQGFCLFADVYLSDDIIPMVNAFSQETQ